MDKIYLECEDDKSSKFWEALLLVRRSIRYGKLGTDGRFP